METETKTSQEIQLFAFGSCETDQYVVVKTNAEGKEQVYKDATQSKAACNITQFTRQHSFNIHSIACGALHTLLLSTSGKLFSFGCNDDGALGRQGDEKTPLPVELAHPVDKIAAGDSHSIACNSVNSLVYYWGNYRTTSGNMNLEAKHKPERIGEKDFAKKQITKILSGANHTLVLTEGRIYVWGDPDTSVLGRMPLARRKMDQALRIEALGVKNVEDIFTGAYHSFCKVSVKKKDQEPKTEIYAWGLNNYGQLGIGNTKNTYTPTLVEAFIDKPVKKITGGEHHTIALLENGDVYSFGRDDDGQCGLGEDFKEEREMEEEKPKKPAKKPSEKKAKGSAKGKGSKKKEEGENGEKKAEGEEANAEGEKKDEGEKTNDNAADHSSAKKDDNAMEEEKAEPEAKEGEAPAEGEGKTFKYVVNPHKVAIEKVKDIFSASSYSYCLKEDNTAYSWGCGDQFVLGTRNEDTVFEPTKVNPKQFNEMKVIDLALGSQHVIFLATSDATVERPKFEDSVTQKIEEEKPAKKTASARSKSKGKKDEEEEGAAKEDQTESKAASGKKGTKTKATPATADKKDKEEEKETEAKEDAKASTGKSTRGKSKDKAEEKKSAAKGSVGGKKRGAPTSNEEFEKEANEGSTSVKKGKVSKGKSSTASKKK
mmetsp:Transcript_49913/g.57474  ORF Transcript_49913/g.57474 Transcript_49913/m.57474 type:complete len:656 (-) Transcript_49913:138-2105(-)